MILIADSGSTKTDWRLINKEGKVINTVQSKGMNPYFLTAKEIASIIREKVAPQMGQVERIWFYGAGCGLPEKVEQMRSAIASAIQSSFPPDVSGDMLGAARSLLQDQTGIACILGTGSNSCVYNGKDITDNVPSLGYILADWGSGAVLCKDLIALILQENIDQEIIKDFNRTYQMDRREILDRLYNKPMANTFLASFTPFLLKHADNSSCRDIILSNFKDFFQYYVLKYSEYRAGMKVSFVGSIAHYFRQFIEVAASEWGIVLGEIVINPMAGLVRYHSKPLAAKRE